MNTKCNIVSKVHLIDGDHDSRGSLRSMLETDGLQVAEYGTAAEFLIAARAYAHGCVLIDAALRGIDAMELMKKLQALALAPPFIFVSRPDDVALSVQAMKLGAIDCIVKPARAEPVIAAVRKAMEVDAARRELRKLRARFDSLTPAECVILFGIADNKLNKQIAAELGVCERTVKTRRARMMSKLRIATVPEIVKAVTMLETTGTWSAMDKVFGSNALPAKSPIECASRARHARVSIEDNETRAAGIRRAVPSYSGDPAI